MFNAILLPIDGSSLSFAAVKPAIDLAKLSSSKIVVLSVAEPRLFRGGDSESIETGQEAEALRLDVARKNVQKIQANAEQAGVACECIVTMSATPRDEILGAARSKHCGLIVMATRGKMSVMDTIFGESATQEVIRKSPVPVLVLP